ncbi:NADP-dependent oxidoreductase [Janibacter sp. DB-40]|uniref:NADP-dependent oxidoreductase n=1 Tax=Janibacter sp. DB-40 TaxID=3028808 RepID=UPI0024059628|nr:NADP-dependent oxidoreductase [Janibacter sp. DB-40]
MSRQYLFTEYGGPEVEAMRERPAPEPGPGQLLIEVRAAGVNPVDVKIREGRLGRERDLPAPMGREAAGIVTAVGPDVAGFAVGDEVLGLLARGEGGFADHALLAAASTVTKPEDIGFEVAATVPVAGTTAYDLTHQVELEAGQSLLVLGAGGGVGHLVTQIGRVHGFRVIGVAFESERELVESSGATFVPAGQGALAAVQELVPEGADLLIDLVGGEALWDLAPAAVSPERVLSAADADTAAQIGGAGRVSDPESLEKIASVIGYGVVTPEIRATFGLARAREALAAVEVGHARGKVVIVP